MKNMPFGRFNAGLRRSNQLAVVGGILFFGGLAAIFAELEVAGLLNRQRLAAKRSGYASC
jgi:succinate-acetate transporter protein